MGRLAALRFALGKGRPVPGERTVSLRLPNGRHQSALVVPACGQLRGTIVAVHGLTPLGETDPRWVSALRDLSAVGFTVVAPRFEDVTRLEIHAGQAGNIADALCAVVHQPQLAPHGRAGIFTVSFSGGMCLRAAAQPRLAGRISGVCAIGTYGDLAETMAALFAREDGDQYGMLIVLANFIDRAWTPIPGAREALLKAAADGVHFKGDPGDPCDPSDPSDPSDQFSTLSEADRDALIRLLTRPEERLRLLARLREVCAEELAAFDPLVALPDPSLPVTLLHGTHDPVIPASQSVRLADALREKGLQTVRLSVTRLLTHGDRQLSPMLLLREGPRTLAALAGFIADCTTAPKP